MGRRAPDRLATRLAAIAFVGAVMAVCDFVPADAARAGDRLIARGLSVDENSFSSNPLAAYGGVLAWLRDGSVDDEGNVVDYRLVVRAGGITRDAPVPPLAGRGLDVGPGRDGSPVVVYARCARGCDLYEYSVRSDRERRLDSLSSAAPELAGAAWRGRYVFTRAGRFPGLFASDPVRRIARSASVEIDLWGDVAAFTGATGPRRNTESGDARDSAVITERVTRQGRPRGCVVARARPPELGSDDFSERTEGRGDLRSTRLDGGYVYWVKEVTRRGRPVLTTQRRRLPDLRCRPRGRTQTASLSADAIAVDRGKLFYVVGERLLQATGRRTTFR